MSVINAHLLSEEERAKALGEEPVEEENKKEKKKK